MREERILLALRKTLGLAMIVAGIRMGGIQWESGGARARLEEARPANVQASEGPRIANAKLETRTVGTSLDATLRELAASADKSEWVGYAVEEVAGERGVCCDNNWDDGNCGTCRLEKENGGTTSTAHTEVSVKLEGARQLVVLDHLEAKQVVKIRVASEDCALDAGGLPFVWLTGVKAP